MADFVIDEWLWDDSSGTNGLRHQREALRIITGLAASDHRLVFVEGSAFDHKAWSLCKSTNVVVKNIVRQFHGRLRYNLDRCLILRPDTVVDLPGQLALATKAKDHYLLRAQLTVPGSILVTTDTPLHHEVVKAALACLFRGEFLETYILD